MRKTKYIKVSKDMSLAEAGMYAGKVATDAGFKKYSLGFGMMAEYTDDKGEKQLSDIEAGTVTIIIKQER